MICKSCWISVLMVLLAGGLLRGQSVPGVQKLNGYWIESDDRGFSFSSILAFDQDENGKISGTAYFLDDSDQTREYIIDQIEFSNDTLFFALRNTTVYFCGVLSTSGKRFDGAFILEGNNSVTVHHRWMSAGQFRALRGDLINRRREIKREIDAKSGLIISRRDASPSRKITA